MNLDILQAIESLGREKGIEKESIMLDLESALAAAAKKALHTKEDVEGTLNRTTGEMKFYKVKTVAETISDPLKEISVNDAVQYKEVPEIGDKIRFPIDIDPFEGRQRVAAQMAKQVLMQKIHERERAIIYEEFKDRQGMIINGTVKRFEKQNIILDIGRTEGIISHGELPKREKLSIGERVRAIIIDVKANTKGPQVILSRAEPMFVVRLFEMEVPEIYEGTVVIKGIARDAGDRSKVAVHSKDKDIDPIGACIGMRGMRVQAITRELKGEKMDIVLYREEPDEFIKAALAPAKVTRVQLVDSAQKIMEIIVPEDQVSLTIGKKGQNVRLTSELCGYQLKVRSEEEKKKEILEAMNSMTQTPDEEENSILPIKGITEKTKTALKEAGYGTIESLLNATVEELTSIPHIGEKTVVKIKEAVSNMDKKGAE